MIYRTIGQSSCVLDAGTVELALSLVSTPDKPSDTRAEIVARIAPAFLSVLDIFTGQNTHLIVLFPSVFVQARAFTVATVFETGGVIDQCAVSDALLGRGVPVESISTCAGVRCACQ